MHASQRRFRYQDLVFCETKLTACCNKYVTKDHKHSKNANLPFSICSQNGHTLSYVILVVLGIHQDRLDHAVVTATLVFPWLMQHTFVVLLTLYNQFGSAKGSPLFSVFQRPNSGVLAATIWNVTYHSGSQQERRSLKVSLQQLNALPKSDPGYLLTPLAQNQSHGLT